MFSEDSDFALAFWPAFLYWFFFLAVFVYGAVVGSFLNVIIFRLPLLKPGENWLQKINGKSYCPHCGYYLRWWQNVPLIGFLVLRGRCFQCRSPISWRYFMVELTTACLWAALYKRISPEVGMTQMGPGALIPWIDLVFQALFAAILVALVFIDLDHFIAPDELNLVGFFVGLLRDLSCLGIAYLIARQMNAPLIGEEYIARFAYFGWLPRALIGAVVYSALLYLVAFVGFVYYAKGEKESLGEVTGRFFRMEDLPEEKMTDREKQMIAEAVKEEEEMTRLGPPPRLRFSPGFLAILCTGFLIPSLGLGAAIGFLLPFLGFLAISRQSGESIGHVWRRFFSSNDLEGPPEHPTVREAEPTPTVDLPVISTAADLEALAASGNPLPTEPELVTPESDLSRTMQQEADDFARDAESGRYGGMGLGDVKLAAAIGAILGPWMSLFSLFFATLIGAVVGVIFTRIHNRSLRYGVPFVPFMAAGAILVMLFGESLILWYLTVSGIRKPEPKPDPPRLLRRTDRPATSPTPDPTRPFQER
ncbi:MAG: prepilin peptidase [Capsulimonadales bacterium]|nr:prepilin peptidase [Capsulimonadales bacterium]